MAIPTRFEHLLVDRITPLLLIMVLPLLGMMYVTDKHNDAARRAELIASCERGNVLRRHQMTAFTQLQRMAGTLAEVAPTQAERADYRRVGEDLRITRSDLHTIRCDHIR